MVECKPEGVTVSIVGSEHEPWIKLRVPSGKELAFPVPNGIIGRAVATEIRNLSSSGENVAVLPIGRARKAG
jgi:hypothetical protein